MLDRERRTMSLFDLIQIAPGPRGATAAAERRHLARGLLAPGGLARVRGRPAAGRARLRGHGLQPASDRLYWLAAEPALIDPTLPVGAAPARADLDYVWPLSYEGLSPERQGGVPRLARRRPRGPRSRRRVRRAVRGGPGAPRARRSRGGRPRADRGGGRAAPRAVRRGPGRRAPALAVRPAARPRAGAPRRVPRPAARARGRRAAARAAVRARRVRRQRRAAAPSSGRSRGCAAAR